MSSSLTAFAGATYGASLIASADFPYLPVSSTTDALALPTSIVGSATSTIEGISNYYNQPFSFKQSDMTSCYDAAGNVSSVDVHACRNSSFVSGTFLFDPGCQTQVSSASEDSVAGNARIAHAFNPTLHLHHHCACS